MQFFYLKKDTELRLPHKFKILKAVTREELSKKILSFDKIYCGCIAWEYHLAKQKIGSENVYLLNLNIAQAYLPYEVKNFTSAGDIYKQIKTLKSLEPNNKVTCFNCILINGTGTMLGDTIIGSSVLEHICRLLKSKNIELIVDVATAFNARPGVEKLWTKIPGIRQVFDSSITLAQLRAYDFYWDFSSLLIMQGLESMHLGDFYFYHLGVNPNTIDPRLKLPTYRLSRKSIDEAKELLIKLADNKPIVFFQAEASTPARSIPNHVFVSVLKQLAREKDFKVVITNGFPKGLTNFERSQIINLAAWTTEHIDRYFAIITLSQLVISVDTLSIHIAMAAQKPGIGLFSISEPTIRLKYSPQIKGLLIPNAHDLPYWNKHKHDEHWEKHQALYEKAWEELKLAEVIKDEIARHLEPSYPRPRGGI